MRLARMSGGCRLAAAKRPSVGSPSALAKAETSRSGGGFSRSRARFATDRRWTPAGQFGERHVPPLALAADVFSKGHTLPHGFAAWREYVK